MSKTARDDSLFHPQDAYTGQMLAIQNTFKDEVIHIKTGRADMCFRLVLEAPTGDYTMIHPFSDELAWIESSVSIESEFLERRSCR